MKSITIGLVLFFIPIGGFIAIMVYELLRLHREKRAARLRYRRFVEKFANNDPEGCPHCGAIAGACPAYPHCPGGMPQ